ncbi:MAG TPA: serine/threonine-protein kinase [Nannocystaceae bacterium]|nr:serine/threonine-protein kinase [Nannocystaceae bacterium]
MIAAPIDTIDDALRQSDVADAIELASAKADVLAAVVDGTAPVVRVGRYLVLDRIGAGACSVVYGAYDPELHRRVALKVLRPQRRRGAFATEIVLREARAIAQLSHPNVVAVHDVGQLDDGGVFFVMELVEGETLEAWRATTRSWMQVVDAMIPIGRALQAAHARGLVHRDVKPSNVLVGRDGRPRLADFGLVAIAEGGDPFAGAAVGTPVTMAPEQHLGRVADARCDQYGFAATLHIALHGRPPFAARSALGLLREKLTRAPMRSAANVPSWLLDVVERGLAADPSERFADMAAMVSALERGRHRRSRRARASLLLVPLLSLAALGMRGPEAAHAQHCIDEGEAAVAALWNDDTRAPIHASAVASTIDAHLAEWRSARTAACAGERTAVSAQLACLDERLAETGELVQLLGDADPVVARGALDAARALTPVGVCEESSPAVAELDEVDVVLRRARLHESMGRHTSAMALVEQALADPRIDPFGAARAHATMCRIATYESDRAIAAQRCDEALLAAERSGHTSLAIAGMIRLAKVSDSAAAEQLLRLADARLAGHVDDAAMLRAKLGIARVMLREQQQRLYDAAAEARAGLAFAESSFPPDAPEVVAAINEVANTDARIGRLASAEAAYHRALAITIRVRGRDEPDVGALLNNLGGVENDLGRPADALGTLMHALEIKIAIAGPDSASLVNTLVRIARAWSLLGQHETALAIARHAHSLSGPDRSDPTRRHGELELAAIELAAGECVRALDTLAGAEAGLAHASDDERGQARWLRGECRARLGLPGDLADLDEAIAALERYYGGSARDVLPPLLASARRHRELGELERARTLLARARSIVARTEGDPRIAQEVEAAWAML